MPNFPSEQGFLGPDAMLDRYARQSGRPLADLNWYIAFGYFKLAVIAAGIHARYLQGKTVGSGFEVFGGLRDSTLAAAAERLSA
jgi:aminoglycoside phosphotransferase (APT) family kinase protein